VTVTLDNKCEINRLFLVVSFLECAVTNVVLFSTVAFNTLIFH